MDKTGIPSKSEFNGKIVITTNELPDDDVLLSRCFTKEVKFTLKERINLLREFAEQEKIPTELVDYITLLANGGNAEQINFRFLLKANEFHNQNSWKEFIDEELAITPEIKAIIDITSIMSKTNDQIKEFRERTGYQRSAFFKYKNKYGQKSTESRGF